MQQNQNTTTIAPAREECNRIRTQKSQLLLENNATESEHNNHSLFWRTMQEILVQQEKLPIENNAREPDYVTASFLYRSVQENQTIKLVTASASEQA